MTLDYERKGVRLLNESDLDDFVDRALAAESACRSARAQVEQMLNGKHAEGMPPKLRRELSALAATLGDTK